MRVPERPHMTQEAALFLRREIEPAFLYEGRKPLITACQGVPCASAASQAMRMAAVSRATLLDCGTATSSGTTPLAACRRGNWPRRETIIAIPLNPSRRAPIRASTMVRPEPISAIDFAVLSRSGGTTS